jgi:pyrimidine operon attenuation protein/uracil phosphoribosyltransferase
MKEILNETATHRTLKRITHEIIERYKDLNNLLLVGIESKGVPLAKEIQKHLKTFEDVSVDLMALDIRPYRDDLKEPIEKNVLSETTKDKDVVIVDDVLQSGRSVRAAIEGIIDHGRPASISLAILIDRGHRELPIRPDFIGKNIPTSSKEKVVFDPESFTVFLKS